MSSVTADPATPAPPPEAVKPQEESRGPGFVKRRYKDGDTDVIFDFLVIDKPELWKPASEFTSKHVLNFGDRKIALNVKSLSYKQWEGVELGYPLPEITSPMSAQETYELREPIRRKRYVNVLELSTGMLIPGSTLEEKVEWLMGFGAGHARAAYTDIVDHFSNTENGSLMDRYYDLISKPAVQEVATASSFEDLLAASQTGSFFRMQRPFEDYIIEIPLRHLSDSQKNEIDSQCKEPLPPGKPGKNPTTGKPDAAFMEYNRNDARYLESLKAVNRLKLVLQFDAILPFKIPGSGFAEKWEWLSSRMIGDVVKLQEHINEKILNYQSALRSFSIA